MQEQDRLDLVESKRSQKMETGGTKMRTEGHRQRDSLFVPGSACARRVRTPDFPVPSRKHLPGTRQDVLAWPGHSWLGKQTL